MRASHHKQQRTSDRRGLGAALCVGGCDRSSPAAHDKAQGRARVRPVVVCRSAPTSGLTQFLPVRTGGGFGSRLFSRRCAWRAAPQFRFSDHLPCRDTDLLKAHSTRRLSGVQRLDNRDNELRGFDSVQKPFDAGAKDDRRHIAC